MPKQEAKLGAIIVMYSVSHRNPIRTVRCMCISTKLFGFGRQKFDFRNDPARNPDATYRFNFIAVEWSWAVSNPNTVLCVNLLVFLLKYSIHVFVFWIIYLSRMEWVFSIPIILWSTKIMTYRESQRPLIQTPPEWKIFPANIFSSYNRLVNEKMF